MQEYRKEYMPACGYEFYLRVVNSMRERDIELNTRRQNSSGQVIFCLLYKPTSIHVFLRSSEDFRKFSKIAPKARRTFPNIFRTNFRRFPKITEDFRGLMMFWSYMYSDTSDYFLRDYVAIAMAIFFFSFFFSFLLHCTQLFTQLSLQYFTTSLNIINRTYTV